MTVGRVFCIVTMTMLGGSALGVPGFAHRSAHGGVIRGGSAALSTLVMLGGSVLTVPSAVQQLVPGVQGRG